MKIAIHQRSGSFSDKWIDYCEMNNIPYKLVNCYSNNIINELEDCEALMWHHHHENTNDVLIAKQLLYSIEQSGKIVFPDFKTNWHFDDKVGQKYLLEAIGAPLIPAYVFLSKDDALKWLSSTTLPKVFKLRGGAGSLNVKLVKNKHYGKKLINKAFSKGFQPIDPWESIQERYRKVKEGKAPLRILINGLARLIFKPDFNKSSSRHKSYVYFQDFIPNLDSDVRVVVVGNKAIAIKRMTREGDFRASGSGNLIFENENINLEFIKKSFEIFKKIKAQSLALDFVMTPNGIIYLVEISYGFPSKNFLDGSSGYWDDNLIWHEGRFNPQAWMVDTIVDKIGREQL